MWLKEDYYYYYYYYYYYVRRFLKVFRLGAQRMSAGSVHSRRADQRPRVHVAHPRPHPRDAKGEAVGRAKMWPARRSWCQCNEIGDVVWCIHSVYCIRWWIGSQCRERWTNVTWSREKGQTYDTYATEIIYHAASWLVNYKSLFHRKHGSDSTNETNE